jgi:hypothetical protein
LKPAPEEKKCSLLATATRVNAQNASGFRIRLAVTDPAADLQLASTQAKTGNGRRGLGLDI